MRKLTVEEKHKKFVEFQKKIIDPKKDVRNTLLAVDAKKRKVRLTPFT